MASQYWLFKSEPSVYSFQDLVRDGKANWDHVRNFQARNFLKEVKKGDQALIYHSNDDKAAVGIARCVREGYPDIDTDDGKEWVQIDLAPVRALARPVTLSEMKATAALKDMLLIRQSRLSCSPVSAKEFAAILALSEKAVSASAKERPARKTPKSQLSAGKLAKVVKKSSARETVRK